MRIVGAEGTAKGERINGEVKESSPAMDVHP